MSLGYNYDSARFQQTTGKAVEDWTASSQSKSASATPIRDPNSPEFKAFYDGLVVALEGQVEPFEILARELQDPAFIFIAVTDGPLSPDQSPKLLSGTYASLVPLTDGSSMLAVRFALTVEEERHTGVSLVTYDRLILEGRRLALLEGRELSAMIGEAVETSERFLNKVNLITAHNRKRLYIPQENGELREFEYALPPLEWNQEGAPSTDPIKEHLMLAHTGSSLEVSSATLISNIREWWKQWYYRPRENFESDAAWSCHRETVDDHFERTIIQPLQGIESLTMLSANEREQLRLQGRIVHDFVLE